jgi:hypothetical protein
MRCKTCDYPLWNLKARQCPECGTTFAPSEFEFVLNSVRFCCPHCDQAYYGTGEKGHLVPDEFNCVKCGARLGMDDMVLRPAQGVQEEQTKVERMPWLERSDRGMIKAWFATVGQALVQPMPLMRALPDHAPAGAAWTFALITTLVIGVINTIPRAGIVFMFFVPGMTGGGPRPPTRMLSVIFIVPAVLMFIMPPLAVAIGGLIVHGLLRVTGPTAAPIGRTWQALCYSVGANIGSAVPCVGHYFGWIWWTVSAALMVKQAQMVSGLRASIAVSIAAIVGIASWVGAYALLMAIIMGGMARGMGGPGSPVVVTPSEVSIIVSALQGYASAHGGYGPAHGTELMTDANPLSASDFVLANSQTHEDQVPVADATLEDLQFLPANRVAAIARNAGDLLPSHAVAHRVGDFVFTHHGIDFNSADGELWIVVASPEMTANSFQLITQTVLTGSVDGRVKVHAPSRFAAALAEQNELRRAAGLASLPDPRLVTHASPAVPMPSTHVDQIEDEPD